MILRVFHEQMPVSEPIDLRQRCLFLFCFSLRQHQRGLFGIVLPVSKRVTSGGVMVQGASDYKSILRKTKLFNNLSDSDFELVCQEALIKEHEHHKGDIIWEQGERVNKLVVVCTGRMVSHKEEPDRKKFLLRFYDSGHCVMLETAVSHIRTSIATINSCKPGTYITLELDKLIASDALPMDLRYRLLHNVLILVSHESFRFINKAVILSRKNVKDRVFTFLSAIAERENGKPFDIGMNQREFARYLNIDNTSLSSVLNTLQREDKLSFKGSCYEVHASKDEPEQAS